MSYPGRKWHLEAWVATKKGSWAEIFDRRHGTAKPALFSWLQTGDQALMPQGLGVQRGVGAGGAARAPGQFASGEMRGGHHVVAGSRRGTPSEQSS